MPKVSCPNCDALVAVDNYTDQVECQDCGATINGERKKTGNSLEQEESAFPPEIRDALRGYVDSFIEKGVRDRNDLLAKARDDLGEEGTWALPYLDYLLDERIAAQAKENIQTGNAAKSSQQRGLPQASPKQSSVDISPRKAISNRKIKPRIDRARFIIKNVLPLFFLILVSAAIVFALKKQRDEIKTLNAQVENLKTEIMRREKAQEQVADLSDAYDDLGREVNELDNDLYRIGGDLEAHESNLSSYQSGEEWPSSAVENTSEDVRAIVSAFNEARNKMARIKSKADDIRSAINRLENANSLRPSL